MKLFRYLLLPIAILGVGLCAGTSAAIPLGVKILTPDQVLRERARVGEDGLLYLEDGEGALRRFVTSTSDPIIRNPGDGSFHPHPALTVEAALGDLDARFLDSLRFEIDILPYPVVEPLGSWTGERAIYLSPGVYSLAEEQVHFVVSHEVGHLVQRRFLPDEDREGWRLYRALRGIEDTVRYSAGGAHRDRPHEIFAEDFRALFGGALGRGASIENPDLLAPDRVPGLRDLFLTLIGADTAPASTIAAFAYPNPFAAGELLRFAVAGAPASAVSDVAIFDLSGRRVASLTNLRPAGNGIFGTTWDARDDAGRPLPRGAYFCKLRSGGVAARISLTLVR